MNSISEDYLFMYLKVRNHYLANFSVMDTVTTLQAEYVSFNQKVDTFINLLANSTADTSGYTADKENKRIALENLSLKISNALSAYAISINNSQLHKLADYPTSYFKKASSEDLIARAKALYLQASPVFGLLIPFGATSTDVTNLNSALNAFVLANPQVSVAIDIRKENAVEAEKTRIAILNQLNNKIDVLVRVFETTNPLLYNLYLSARALDTTGSPTAPNFEGSVTGSSPIVITSIPYSSSREIKIQIIGGNAIWGLSNVVSTI